MERTTAGFALRVRVRASGDIVCDVRFRVNGHQRSLTFATEADARRWADVGRRVGAERALALLEPSAADLPTVADAATDAINANVTIRGSTIRTYRSYLRLSIAPALGNMKVDAVSKDDINRWIAKSMAEGLSTRYVKNQVGFLHSVFERSRQAGHIQENPCQKARVPRKETAPIAFLTKDDLHNLLNFVPDHYKTFVLFLAATGTRFGEATALRPSDFDLSRGTVWIRRTWSPAEHGGFVLGPTKSSRSVREISLPETIVQLLRPLVSAGNTFVFVSRTGRPIRQNNFWSGVWDPARRLANGLAAYGDGRRGQILAELRQATPSTTPIGKFPRVHDLRHSHASWLIEANVPLPVIQRRLGHESITITIDTYGHLSRDANASAASAMEAIFSPEISLLPVDQQ